MALLLSAGANEHRLERTAVDVDRLAIDALAGEVRHVVSPVELLDAAQYRVECTIEHQAGNVPVRNS